MWCFSALRTLPLKLVLTALVTMLGRGHLLHPRFLGRFKMLLLRLDWAWLAKRHTPAINPPRSSTLTFESVPLPRSCQFLILKLALLQKAPVQSCDAYFYAPHPRCGREDRRDGAEHSTDCSHHANDDGIRKHSCGD